MITQSTGAIVNLILDPILIFGLLGMPKLGVAGAAIATVTGQIIAGIMAIIINEKKNYIYPKKKEDFTFDIHKYFEFCTELKKFYVLISRPKTFLLFYEDKNKKLQYKGQKH
mgnify:CR=1 FL=1